MHIIVHYMDWWKWNIPPLHIGLHLFSKIVITLVFLNESTIHLKIIFDQFFEW
jgi:hypothetical protein